MKKITTYDIISAESHSKLIEFVGRTIRSAIKGWQPYGFPFFEDTGMQTVWYQAMVIYEEGK
jgi:hypothetical protein